MVEMIASNLSGKRALITGGSSGVGAAVARLLARRGVTVAINYASNKQRAEASLATLDQGNHALIQGDALSKEGIRDIVKRTVERLGGIDLVVSNVGWTAFGSFNDLNAIADGDWLRCYESNVLTHLWVMQACQEELKRNRGSMVITASVAGLKPSGSSMAYSVSKSATIHLTKSLAIATAPEVRVNCVAAGVMLTDWSKGFTEEHVKNLESNNALRKISQVDDVALTYETQICSSLIPVTLLENGSMTGQCLEVSAGFRL